MCVECKSNKKTYQSLLCIDCQDAQFKRLNNKYGAKEQKKMTVTKSERMETVRNLSEKGLKPKEIAKKAGIPVSTVYTYRTEINKTKNKEVVEEKPKKETSISKMADEALETMSGNKLFKSSNIETNKGKESELLEQKYERSREDYNELKSEHDSLSKEYDELETEYLDLKQELKKSEIRRERLRRGLKKRAEFWRGETNERHNKIKRLKKEIEQLKQAGKETVTEKEVEYWKDATRRAHKGNEQLRKRIDELIKESRIEINQLERELKAERKKHKALHDYVSVKEVS